MGFDAADPNRASAHALRRAEYSADQMHIETQLRITKGYSALVEYFIEQIQRYGGRLISNTQVRQVNWKEGKVKITALQNNRQKNFHADVAAIALPLGILKSNIIKFEPSLPEKIEAVRGMEFGNVVRIIFHFKERTWDDFGFIHAFGEPIPTWWSDSRGPILTGWAGGPRADALRRMFPRTFRVSWIAHSSQNSFPGCIYAVIAPATHRQPLLELERRPSYSRRI